MKDKDGPRLVTFPAAPREGEKVEEYLIRAALRLIADGFTGETLTAMLGGLADRLPNFNVSTAMLERVAETASKFADPATADPFAAPADLSTWREAEAAPWIVPGFLQRGSVTLISARGGTGKSLLSLALAAHLAAGDRGAFLALDLPGERVPVALLDAECGSSRIMRRLRELVVGGEIPAASLDRALPHFYAFTAEHFARRDAVLSRVAELTGRLPDLRVLIVDPLRAFLPESVDDENGNLALGRVLDALVAVAKRENLAVLVVDHDNRAGGAARGASVKRDAAEFLWHLISDSDSGVIEARAEKRRDPGGPESFGFRLVSGTRTPDGLYPVRFERAEIPTAGSGSLLDITAKIRRAVDRIHGRTGCLASVRAIETESGLPRSTVHRHAARMADAGLLYQPEPGSGYGPPSARPDDSEGGER